MLLHSQFSYRSKNKRDTLYLAMMVLKADFQILYYCLKSQVIGKYHIPQLITKEKKLIIQEM